MLPRERRHKGRAGVNGVAQVACQRVGVAHVEVFARIVNRTKCAVERRCAVDFGLVGIFHIGVGIAFNLHTGNRGGNIHMAAKFLHHLAPPWSDGGIVGFCTDFPIHLWRDVVEGLARNPCQRVGENTVVLPVGRTRWARLNAIFRCH